MNKNEIILKFYRYFNLLIMIINRKIDIIIKIKTKHFNVIKY